MTLRRAKKPLVGKGDVLGYAQDLFEVVCDSWLKEKRGSVKQSEIESNICQERARRRAYLEKLTAHSKRLDEIDAKIDLLEVLPESEEQFARRLIKKLSRVRAQLVRQKGQG